MDILPAKIRRERKAKAIKDLYRQGFSMDQICHIEKVSKTTVFFAINGRSVRNDARKAKRKKLKSFFKNK